MDRKQEDGVMLPEGNIKVLTDKRVADPLNDKRPAKVRIVYAKETKGWNIANSIKSAIDKRAEKDGITLDYPPIFSCDQDGFADDEGTYTAIEAIDFNHSFACVLEGDDEWEPQGLICDSVGKALIARPEIDFRRKNVSIKIKEVIITDKRSIMYEKSAIELDLSEMFQLLDD